MENLENIAVLIDADNTQLSKLEAVLHELTTYGRIVVKKAYGNWKKPVLKKWEDEVKRLAIKAEQQFDYISGKNTTDIAMIIDAMDLLHTNMYDAFAIVSSDSDFAPLAIRLRESGAYIIGAGENKTPEAFRNACDDFILLEYVAADESESLTASVEEEPVESSTVEVKKKPVKERKKTAKPNIKEINTLLKIAADKYQDEDGYVNVASAGQYIKRVKPDFTPLTYGYSKLSELLKAFPRLYTVKRVKKGNATILTYCCR